MKMVEDKFPSDVPEKRKSGEPVTCKCGTTLPLIWASFGLPVGTVSKLMYQKCFEEAKQRIDGRR